MYSKKVGWGKTTLSLSLNHLELSSLYGLERGRILQTPTKSWARELGTGLHWLCWRPVFPVCSRDFASYWIGQSLFAFRTYISNLSVKGMCFELNKEALHMYLHLILAYFTSHLCLISNIVTIYLWVINKCEYLYWISIILVCKNNGLCSRVLNSSKTTVDSHSTSF